MKKYFLNLECLLKHNSHYDIDSSNLFLKLKEIEQVEDATLTEILNQMKS